MSQNRNTNGKPVRDQHKTVLIVHGSKVLSDLLLSLFRPLPLSVARASTPDEATHLFNLLRPQLLIIGLTNEWLPMLESFRSERPLLEIVALTDSDEIAHKARSMGFENIVLIDENPESLADGIQLFLGDWLTVPGPSNETTILVVDDEAEVVDPLFKYLIGCGYTVRSAQNGRMALEVVQADPSVSIVLLDVVMPEMGGMETLRKLKSQNKDLGIIMMSAFADREIVRQALGLGAFDFVLKPLDIDQLDATIWACQARLQFRKKPWWKRFAARSV